MVSEDEPGDAPSVLASGKVKVVLFGESGREVILSIFSRPGELRGDGLLDDAPRSATVQAMEPSRCWSSPGPTSGPTSTGTPHRLQASPSSRAAAPGRRGIIWDLALLDVFGRLAAKLRALGRERRGGDRGRRIPIRQRPTQAEIAAMIGTAARRSRAPSPS